MLVIAYIKYFFQLTFSLSLFTRKSYGKVALASWLASIQQSMKKETAKCRGFSTILRRIAYTITRLFFSRILAQPLKARLVWLTH